MNMIDRLVLLISKRNGRFHHARGMHRNRRIVLQHIAQRRNRLPYVYLGAYGHKAHLSSAADKLNMGRVQMARLVERADLPARL